MPEMHKHVRPPAQEGTPIENTPGILNKVRYGRLAVVSAGVEVVAGVIAVLTKDPLVAEMGLYFDACLAGGTLFGANQYFNNGDKKPDAVAYFIKDKSTDIQDD